MTDPFKRGAAIYVDVDDTLVRHASIKAVPIPHVIAQVRRLHARGFSLYCWSTGGAEYAQRIVTEIGLADCFTAFLPKPTILIDDHEMSAWLLKTFHPMSIDDASVDAYLP
jgi:phosphoglycolate phosphatase-like HAD superfamily hydrolase